jgi:hypothetical protein
MMYLLVYRIDSFPSSHYDEHPDYLERCRKFEDDTFRIAKDEADYK